MHLLNLIAVIASLVSVGSSTGASTIISQKDLNEDGTPDLTVLRASFASTEDTVLVFDRNNNMVPGADWMLVTDFVDDIWIFDAEADGTANLIVEFGLDSENRPVAYLFDDVDGDQMVTYEVHDKEVEIMETQFPTVRVVARSGDWRSLRKPTFNLDIFVDGNVNALFGSSAYSDRFSTDGVEDFDIQVWDVDQDGAPDYDIRRAHTLEPESASWVRSNIVAAVDLPAQQMAGSIFWPYLRSWVSYERPYNAFPAPIQVDWTASKIISVSEFIPGRRGGGQYFIYTLNPLSFSDPVAYANFENPFAFYDLSSVADGYPDLQIRVRYHAAKDVYWPCGGRFPMTHVRYSWDQEHDHSWNFALHLAGRHAVTHTVAIPNLNIETVPYELLPMWVVERPWDVAAFVEVEKDDPPYWTTEGIYEWDVPYDVTCYYLFGHSEQPPTGFQDIAVGFRGEYNYTLQEQPVLYFSSIDNKLHLRDAEKGVWALEDRARMEYRDADGDGYVDEWQYRVTTFDDKSSASGGAQGQLYHVDGQLIYSADNQITLTDVTVAPFLFETLPPTNQAEWLSLAARLEEYQRDFAPGNLEDLAGQFGNANTRIEGASLRDFRRTDGGFRFVIELQPECSAKGDPQLASLLASCGTYVITYRDGQYAVRPVTPPHLTATHFRLQTAREAAQELAWTSIRGVLVNDGLDDARDIPVYAVLSGPNGALTVLTATIPLVAAQGSQSVEWEWCPVAAGQWLGRLEVDNLSDTGDLTYREVLTESRFVVEPSSKSWYTFLFVEREGFYASLVILFSGGLLAAVAIVLWMASGVLARLKGEIKVNTACKSEVSRRH